MNAKTSTLIAIAVVSSIAMFGFVEPIPQWLSFFAVAEAILAEHLGGRYEPIGDDLDGSSISVPVGADQIPGLREAPQSK